MRTASLKAQKATSCFPFRRDIEAMRLVDYAAERLRMLCEGAGYGAETERVVETFQSLILPWAEVPAGYRSGWQSDISDDHTPIEFSVAFADGCPEVRVLFEVQAEQPTLQAQREVGLAFAERLQREFGADLTRFREVEDLFLPADMAGTFSVWYSAVFPLSKAPQFKAYFNPQAQGPARAQALVEQALRRLGLPRSWPELTRTAMRRGPYLDELKYFALDLGATAEARVKVYVQHHLAKPEELEIACSAAHSYEPGEALRFTQAMAGGINTLVKRSPFTCSNFVSGRGAAPEATTLYVPVCAYAKDDSVVRERISTYLRKHAGESSAYEKLLEAFANRKLEVGTGLHSWAAFRRYQGSARFTVYLGTESREVFAPGAIPAATTNRALFRSSEEIVARFEALDITQHPFLQRLMSEPSNPDAVWLFIHNTYEGTSKHFIRWLASLTAQVEDEQVRCLLARQLDQELGEGDFSQAHSVLMRAFLAGLEKLKPAHVEPGHLEAGRRLGRRMARHYQSADWYESLASLMAGEVCAHAFISCVARMLKPQQAKLSPVALQWLRAHEELEGNHADESLVLARLVPREKAAMTGVFRGTSGVFTALWSFLDDMYGLCFGTGVAAELTPVHFHTPLHGSPQKELPAYAQDLRMDVQQVQPGTPVWSTLPV